MDVLRLAAVLARQYFSLEEEEEEEEEEEQEEESGGGKFALHRSVPRRVSARIANAPLRLYY